MTAAELPRANHPGRPRVIGPGAVAQLTEMIEAPAVGRIPECHCTSVLARIELSEAEVPRNQRRRAAPECAAPAVRPISGAQGTAMLVTRARGFELDVARDRRRL